MFKSHPLEYSHSTAPVTWHKIHPRYTAPDTCRFALEMDAWDSAFDGIVPIVWHSFQALKFQLWIGCQGSGLEWGEFPRSETHSTQTFHVGLGVVDREFDGGNSLFWTPFHFLLPIRSKIPIKLKKRRSFLEIFY